ncbi:MAG: efflux RND transporter permease subunit [Alphaproteobacteria bacterium]|jgi:multidrug efflux pump subunit AcrB|nr:efflux RND transporter permease subunit [Alphaproteobacteria bacterium]
MIRFFARHPTAANLMMLGIMVAGLLGLPTLLRETFPPIPADEVEIRTLYPGASADEVEEAVCRRIEDAVEKVDDLDEVRCSAVESLGVTTVVMHESADFDRFLGQVKTEVEAIDDFPEDVEAPIIRQLGLTDFVVSVAVAGPMSAPDLKAFAEGLKDRMLRHPKISQVAIRGFSDHQIRIEAPALTLRKLGLSAQDLADIVRRQSLDLPSGTVETTERDILIRFTDRRRTAAAFADIVVIGGATGAEVRLGDIARISDRFELDEERTLFNGQRAAVLDITKRRNEDTLETVDAVRELIERERQIAPPGVAFALTRDVASIVRDRLNLLLKNGLQGLVLVLLVMTAFFSFRFSFWVAMGLPVSFLGALAVMVLFSISINMITMVALLIALGLLMDDAIVIAENIAARLERGDAPFEAAVKGTAEVAPGVLASFATTIVVFAPLSFLAGEIGAILRVLPVVLIAVLSVSLVEAFLILPSHLAHSLAAHANSRQSRLRLRVEAAVEHLRQRVLGPTVDAAVAWRYPFIGAVLAVFLISIAMVAGGVLKFRAFPELDGDVVVARILLPQGTPLARTETVVAQVVASLKQVDEELTPLQPKGKRLVRNVLVSFAENTDSGETGPHVATVSVDLLGAEERRGRVQEIQNRWREVVGMPPDVLQINFKQAQIGPGGRAIEVRLQGDDLAVMKRAAVELQDWLAGYSGVFDVADDLRPGKPEVRLRLREGAASLGLDAQTIARQLRAAFFGATAAEIQVGNEAYEIDVRLARSDQNSLTDLEYFTVTGRDGRQIPLDAVARYESGRGYGRIARVDGRRTVTVTADLDSDLANANEVLADTQARFLPDLLARHPGIVVTLEGQAEEQGKTMASMLRAATIALVGLFLVLSFLFRSYVEPVIVMVAIPFAFVGVVWGHLALGLELSMPSLMGFVALAGIVVNDSILLVNFVKRHARSGLAVHDAARQASRDRFRAVLLTSLTTIVGLLPLLSETSLQAQILIPLAASLAFGLLASTLLVLLVVPALYTILEDFGLARIEAEGRTAAAIPG